MDTTEIMNKLQGVSTLIDMDNVMEDLGFQSIFDEVDERTLLENGSASYLIPETDYSYINIIFEADRRNGIKVLDVEEI